MQENGETVQDVMPPAWMADQAEEAVLGACMLGEGVVTALANQLSARDFLSRPYGRFYEFLQGMETLGEPVTDTSLVVMKLKKTNLFKQLGGASGLARLAVECASVNNAPAYAQEIRDAADRRRLADMFATFYERLKDPRVKARDAMSALQSEVAVLGLPSDADAIQLHAAAHKAIDRIEKAKESKYSVGVQTGVFGVDSVTGGLYPGELTILAARPGIGKSAFAGQIADYAAGQNRPALFISMEMEEWEIAGRWLSGASDVDSRAIRSGLVSDEDVESLKLVADQYRDHPYWIWRPRKPTIAMIRAKCKEIAIRHGLALVVVDYIQLIRGDNARDLQREQLSQIGKDLKDLASEMQVPVLALSQLNRGAEDERPSLSMLSGSGTLEQDANAVWMLHRARDSNDGVLLIEKNRAGQTGEVSMQWDGAKTCYRDPATVEDFS